MSDSNALCLLLLTQWVDPKAQYPFLNLTYAELIFWLYHWDLLIDLLGGCPSLQNLIIVQVCLV